MSLRDQLAGKSPLATPFRILCPPGWRRVAPEEITGELTELAAQRLKDLGRPDLLLQLRSLAAEQRRSMLGANVLEAYLPPLAEHHALPAVLTVSTFVLPAGVDWGQALTRLARGASIAIADFAETAMWVWTREERFVDREQPVIRSRARHFVVPVPEGGDRPTRALQFVFTVLDPGANPDRQDVDATSEILPTDAMLEVADLILSTLRWLAPPQS